MKAKKGMGPLILLLHVPLVTFLCGVIVYFTRV